MRTKESELFVCHFSIQLWWRLPRRFLLLFTSNPLRWHQKARLKSEQMVRTMNPRSQARIEKGNYLKRFVCFRWRSVIAQKSFSEIIVALNFTFQLELRLKFAEKQLITRTKQEEKQWIAWAISYHCRLHLNVVNTWVRRFSLAIYSFGIYSFFSFSIMFCWCSLCI